MGVYKMRRMLGHISGYALGGYRAGSYTVAYMPRYGVSVCHYDRVSLAWRR